MKVNFLRGKRVLYAYSSDTPSKFNDALYFATDTGELLMNGTRYGIDGERIKNVEFEDSTNTFTFTKQDDTTVVVSLGNKLLTADDRSLLEQVKDVLENMSANVTYASKLDNSIATVNALGGIKAGTKVSELKGKEISDVLDILIFPTIQPTKVDPSLSLSTTKAKLVKVGTTVYATSDISSTVSRGEIRINNAKKQDYAGEAGDVTITAPTGSTFTYGSNVYSGSVTFAAGPTPLDSKGGTATSILAYPGGTKTASLTVKATYPFYFTDKTDLTKVTEYPLVDPGTKTFEISYELPAENGAVNHVLKAATAHTITKIEMLNTLSGKYETISLDANFVKTTETINKVPYDVFTRTGKNGATKFRITYK